MRPGVVRIDLIVSRLTHFSESSRSGPPKSTHTVQGVHESFIKDEAKTPIALLPRRLLLDLSPSSSSSHIMSDETTYAVEVRSLLCVMDALLWRRSSECEIHETTMAAASLFRLPTGHFVVGILDHVRGRKEESNKRNNY
jgi:hypothetical protein